MCFAPIIQPINVKETRSSPPTQVEVMNNHFYPASKNPFHYPTQNTFKKTVQNSYQTNVFHFFPYNPFQSNELQYMNPYSLNPQKVSENQTSTASVQNESMHVTPAVVVSGTSNELQKPELVEMKSSNVEVCKDNVKVESVKEKTIEDMKKIIEFGKEKKPSGVIPCKFFMKKNGRCKYGNNCRFSHVHFYPMPKTFSEDPIAQQHVKSTVEAVKQKKFMEENEMKEKTKEEIRLQETKVNTEVTENPKKQVVISFSNNKDSTATLSTSTIRCRFNWNTKDMIYREAVHYSSESTDAPTSKVCSAVLKILQESEEYQRIETICNREQRKHAKYFRSMSPAFVGGSLVIMIQLKPGITPKELPMSIPGCIDGVKTQVTCG